MQKTSEAVEKGGDSEERPNYVNEKALVGSLLPHQREVTFDREIGSKRGLPFHRVEKTW